MDFSKIPVWELIILGVAAVVGVVAVIAWLLFGYGWVVTEATNSAITQAASAVFL